MSMHNQTSLSISWPIITYLIKNDPWEKKPSKWTSNWKCLSHFSTIWCWVTGQDNQLQTHYTHSSTYTAGVPDFLKEKHKHVHLHKYTKLTLRTFWIICIHKALRQTCKNKLQNLHTHTHTCKHTHTHMHTHTLPPPPTHTHTHTDSSFQLNNYVSLMNITINVIFKRNISWPKQQQQQKKCIIVISNSTSHVSSE